MTPHITLKTIQSLETRQVKELVDILNYDICLKEAMGSKSKNISDGEFVAHNKKWAKEKRAKMFAIMLKEQAIGVISLGNINFQGETAKIGYWLASKYWHRGYMTEAFGLILGIAMKNNIKSVSCSITKDNKASRAIWEKFNATFEEKEDKVIPSISI